MAQINADEDFEAYQSAIVSDFYSFEDSVNIDFADFLEQAWQVFTVYQGTEPPAYSACWQPCTDLAGGNILAEGNLMSSDKTFFGSPLVFTDFPGRSLSLSGLSEKQIADGWRLLASENFTSFLNTSKAISEQLSLNGWGEYLLMKEVCYNEYPLLSSSERVLFLFYLLNNSGYKAKIGRGGGEQLVLLLPFREELYRVPYIRIDNEKYYLIEAPSSGLKELYSFKDEYPNAHRMLFLSILQPLCLPKLMVKEPERDKVNFPIQLNKHLLDFYGTYPLCDLSVYFGSKPSIDFVESLSKYLEPQLIGKTGFERVVWLLDFVQRSFHHKPDNVVHGGEKYYFPEETYFYSYTDCEDLSVFLSFLLNQFTDRQVLTLYYPSHVAVAVESCMEYKGEVLTYGGKTYFICDPSYKGAVPGKVIPVCTDIKPVIISYYK